MAIPGIRKIATTQNHLSKSTWTVLILISFALGIYNVSYAASNYYQFDVITNIERVSPAKVTFPAITICALSRYKRENKLQNGSLIKTDFIDIRTDNISRIARFLGAAYLDSKENSYHNNLEVISYLDFFKISGDFDCFRFNAATKKRAELFQATSTADSFVVEIKDFYREPISEKEYFHFSFAYTILNVYIVDNFLNSFEELEPLELELNNTYEIEMEKESIEIKLPEPYNPCKESSAKGPNHRWNSVESCISEEIKHKHNCTFAASLFAVGGLKQCEPKRYSYHQLKQEFYAKCLKEAPLEGCFSEKFSYSVEATVGYGSTVFKFSFRDMSTLNITQIPKIDGFTFVNNVGGGLGLFMGIAFPTFIEFLQFAFEIVSVAFNN
jgi:hypothetical protein